MNFKFICIFALLTYSVCGRSDVAIANTIAKRKNGDLLSSFINIIYVIKVIFNFSYALAYLK
jgi:uncharacterized membrane protein YadS